MNLLIYSHYFAPGVGGVETIVQSMAAGIAEPRTLNGDREFNVTVVTETAADGYDDTKFPFHVVRRPGVIRLWQLVGASDVIHTAGPAFLAMFLAWLSRKRFVIEHHGCQATCPNGLFVHQPDRAIFQAGRYGECFQCLRSEFSSGWTAAKLLALMFPRHWLARAATTNIAVTTHVDRRQKLPHTKVIYHGMEDPLPIPDRLQPSQKLRIAYVGRLVPEKGVTVLLEAAKILKSEGHDFEIRIIGDGSERLKLEAFIHRAKLESVISITGFLTGNALARAAGRNCRSDACHLGGTSGPRGHPANDAWPFGHRRRHWRFGRSTWRHGIKLPARKYLSLANCMRRVIENPSLIGAYGERARSRALQVFQRPEMLAGHARTYRGGH